MRDPGTSISLYSAITDLELLWWVVSFNLLIASLSSLILFLSFAFASRLLWCFNWIFCSILYWCVNLTIQIRTKLCCDVCTYFAVGIIQQHDSCIISNKPVTLKIQFIFYGNPENIINQCLKFMKIILKSCNISDCLSSQQPVSRLNGTAYTLPRFSQFPSEIFCWEFRFNLLSSTKRKEISGEFIKHW